MSYISADTHEPTEVIIQPDGPQGAKLGLKIDSAETMKRFDEAVGGLPVGARANMGELRRLADELKISIVD